MLDLLLPLFKRFLEMHFTQLAQAHHLVVPIPLHAQRYSHRRHNQAAEMTQIRCWRHDRNAFCPEILKRPKSAPTQAGLSRKQRQCNAVGAFNVPTAQLRRLSGRRVLVTFAGSCWRGFCGIANTRDIPSLIYNVLGHVFLVLLF